MNRLIGIKKDKEITRIYCATEEEVDKFEEGTTTAPELCPMHPYLNSSQHTSWNDALCKMFIEHFKKEEDIERTPDDKVKIKIMFLSCLNRISWPWRDSHRFSPEELYTKELKSNQLARRNSLRVDISQL